MLDAYVRVQFQLLNPQIGLVETDRLATMACTDWRLDANLSKKVSNQSFAIFRDKAGS